MRLGAACCWSALSLVLIRALWAYRTVRFLALFNFHLCYVQTAKTLKVSRITSDAGNKMPAST